MTAAGDQARAVTLRAEDLLGRPPVWTSSAQAARHLTGRRVLVVGAGGSIGSELCRQVSRISPASLFLLDRDESALLTTQLAAYGRPRLDRADVLLADIRDARELTRTLRACRPHVVFHAAALKHVATLERHPGEAYKTNVLGTYNVLDAAAAVGVERFVNISTDKAADPVTVLGYSKRISEGLTARQSLVTGRRYLSVRFGNVLGSRGSVLGTFLTQIAAGGPVTVTAPEAMRYFLTVQEAVGLVIHAALAGQGGHVLVPEMGDPIRVLDLARRLMDRVGAVRSIEFTGLTRAEKPAEVRLGRGERDSRPSDPLISHVSVPPVDLDRFGAVDPWGEPACVRAHMRRICADMAARVALTDRSAALGAS
ncbi:polysaccharide biosynthesis protein [Phytoactinopolyspora halotolerans]|uniref:polysaccharide biosynthesis protein n=1 Tax=Phytoactinopolyspora halotolerans TaxID=1981512 RepID=UPI001C20BAB4|nr:polysaccharide biosynthesis protein [Phytoactinopolyspora halotolerans]